MKSVKSILLGSAAAFVVSGGGAQAADMLVKARPVEYVKICSIYGPGFYQIPGMGDICVKIGATGRFTSSSNANGYGIPYIDGGFGRNESFDTGGYQLAIDGRIWMDARQMTGFGALREYVSVAGTAGMGAPNGLAGGFYVRNAFIDMGGWKTGKAQSAFDFANGEYSYGSFALGGGSDTYDTTLLFSRYTARFGNGFSATVSVEDGNARRGGLWDAGTNGMAIGSFSGPVTLPQLTGFDPACGAGAVTADQNIGSTAAPFSVASGCAIGDYAAQQIPDIVASLRVDQAWGSAQAMGAVHQVSGNFYGNDTQVTITQGPNAFTGTRPSNVFGWAAGGGLKVNLPTGPHDSFWVEGVYNVGAPSYGGLNEVSGIGAFDLFNGQNIAAGWALDGAFGNAVGFTVPSPAVGGTANFSGILLSSGWTVGAAIEHYWTPAIRTSVFGTYTTWSAGDPNNPASLNTLMCSSPNGPVRTAFGAAPNYATGSVIGCNYNFQVWAVGARGIWNPVPNVDWGIEVMYSEIDQNMNPATVLLNFGGGGNRAAGLYSPANEGTWDVLTRVTWHLNNPPPEESRP